MPRVRSTPPRLKSVEDREIEKIVKKQEEIGLKLATDGEFRRTWWHFDFFAVWKASPRSRPIRGLSFMASRPRHEAIRIDGKVNFNGHPHIEHFKFLKSKCRVTPKMTIPAPSDVSFPAGPRDGEQAGLSGL